MRAEIAKREAEARAHEEARRAGVIATQIQAAALNPPNGWWRRTQKGHRFTEHTLRRDAVMTALAVGCTHGEIRRASGASGTQLSHCIRTAKNGKGAPSLDEPRRRWDDILAAAFEARLPVKGIALDQAVPELLVYKCAYAHRYRVKKGLLVPRDAEEARARA